MSALAKTGPLLEVEGVQKHFPLVRSLGDVFRGQHVRSVHAVDGVSISVQPGETLGLIGESGSGKTTLGWLVARLHEPTGGTIRFDGKEITHLSGEELRAWRRHVQVVFQDPVGSLDPRLRVWQIIGEPIRAQNQMDRYRARLERPRREAERAAAVAQRAKENKARSARGEPPLPDVPPVPPLPKVLSKFDVRARVAAMLPTVGLPVDCLDQYPHEFSGGGRQRVSLARALIVDPRLIILDEPTSALDVAVQAQILNRLLELQRERRIAYLLITHNVAAVRFAADRVAVMYLGQVVEYGTVREVLERPVHPYTKALLAAVPQPDPGRRKKRYRIQGDIPSLVDPKPGCRFAPRCPFVEDRCRTDDPPLVAHPTLGGRVVACVRAEEVADVPPESLLVTADPAASRAAAPSSTTAS